MDKISCHGSIMIVDDEIFFRTMLREILTEVGFDVICEAANGIEAIEKYSVHRPELTIIDIYMPGKNGFEIAKEIFSIDKDAKVLMCSGSGYDEDVQVALKMGVSDVIQKPFIPVELIGTIKKVLGEV